MIHTTLLADDLVALELLPAVTALVVFLAAFVFLYFKVWPIITKGLDERNAKILGEIKAAEEARKSAKAAQMEFEKKIAEAREEATRLITQARAEAQRQAESLRSKMEQDMQERLSRASAEIDAAKRQAILDVHAQTASLATAIAGRILKREITPTDQQRLVDESLRDLAGSRN